MANLWNQLDDGSWQQHPLPAPYAHLSATSAVNDPAGMLLDAEPGEPLHAETPWRVAFRQLPRPLRERGLQARTLLLKRASQRVWVNGELLVTDARLLRSRDVIRVATPDGDLQLCYVDEQVAVVKPFERDAAQEHDDMECPRCQQSIEVGTDSVRCPQCHVVCHQNERLRCWTYTPKCPSCGTDTKLLKDPLSNDLQWTPDRIGERSTGGAQ